MEDQIQAFIENQARFNQDLKGELDMIKSTLSELVHNMMRIDLLIDEESMEQQLNDEPSLPKDEQDPSPKEPKECALPMISIFPQHTPSRAKISFLPSIPTQNIIPSINPNLWRSSKF